MQINKIAVTADRVLVKILGIGEEKKLPSGIIIPAKQYSFDHSELGMHAVCYAVGPYQHDIKEGDRLLIEKYGGVEVPINGEEFVILDANEVLAVLEEEPVNG